MMTLNNNAGMLIRFDDIAPNMNWEIMDKCEKLLNKYNIKPVVGVIPNNKDLELLNYPKKDDFWKIVKNWESNNWSIAMHGYTHVYDNETNKKDYFNYGGKSEFFGHTYEEQLTRIKNGLKIFDDKNIKIETFFAPNHTYDSNTFKALETAGISQVIDGYGISPFFIKKIKFVPQLFYKLYMLPFGLQSTQIHLNYWKDKDYRLFENFIEKNHKKIINLENAFSKENENSFEKIIKVFIEQSLKIKRQIF